MLSIRKATTDDCALIHEMATIVFPATYREILSEEQLSYMLEWMYAPSHIHTQMTEEGHVYFIAYKAGEPCGYISIEQQDKDLFHLQKIYVLPAFQGLHIGAYLFNAAIAYMKEVHPLPCRMELNVNRQNNAVRFYQRMGMHIVRQGDFPIGNGYYMNDYIMAIDK